MLSLLLQTASLTVISDLNPTKLATQQLVVDSVLPAQPKEIAAADLSCGVPTLPNRYRILAVAGCGGMGIVYKAHDIETDEIVALKILKPEIASDETMREKLRQEVCLARRVTHKNVCRIHEFNRGTACISMEFIEGESLSAKLQREGTLSVREAINIARQVCAGLREAHAQGIIHRDLKPGNIMIDRSGNVKIMDFGIARLAEETGPMTQTIVGTPEYMAPEQIELKPITPRSDIYSLGLVLYEMLTGLQPFSGGSALTVALQHISLVPKSPSEVVPGLGSRTDAIVMKCLHRNPAKRFQSVDELEAALALFAKSAARTTKFEIEPSLYSSFQKARAVVSSVDSLAGRLRSATIEINRCAQRTLQSCAVFFRSQRFITPDRIRSAQVAGILGLTFMSTAVAFGLVAGRHSDSISVNVPSRPMKVASNPMSPIKQTMRVTIKPEALFADQSADSRSVDLSASESKTAVIISPSRRISVVMTKKAKAHPEISINPSQVTALSTTVLPLPQADIYPEITLLNTTPALISPSDSPSTKPPDLSAKEQAEPVIALSYLEVGSFKDAKWADSAVTQLDKLGFHAICVHKSLLWMQSYHVQVGPYQNAKDIKAAEQRLSTLGFKTHAVQ